MQVADLVPRAMMALQKLENIQRELERFGPAHADRMLEVLRQSQSRELENVRDQALKEVREKENETKWYNDTMEDVICIAISPEVSTVSVMTRKTAQAFAIELAKKRGSLIMEVPVFLKMVDELKGSVAASTERDQLCRPAQELVYQEVQRRYDNLLGAGTKPATRVILKKASDDSGTGTNSGRRLVTIRSSPRFGLCRNCFVYLLRESTCPEL